MQFCPVRAELFPADGHTDRQTDMMLAVAFRKFANASKIFKRPGPKIYEVGTLIMATIYLQLKQNRYMFRSFTVLQCSHQHCVQSIASDVEVAGYH